MGSGSSRIGSRPSRPRGVNRGSRFKLSFLICGASSSHSPVEMEESHENSTQHCNQINVCPVEGSSLISGSGTGFPRSYTETGHSSENSHVINGNTSAEDGLRNVRFNQGDCLSESKELVPPHQVSVDNIHDESSRDRSSSTASTSFTEQQSSDSVSVSLLANKDAVNGLDNSENRGASQSCPEVIRSSGLSSQGNRDSSSDEVSVQDHVGDVMAVHNTDSSAPHVSDPSATPQEPIPSGLGFLVSNREQGQGDVLHVDVVSISSDILSSSIADTSNREARRNSRRLFWDAFSRRSSRRLSDSPTIIFSTDDTDDMGSHDRWLLDFSGDFFDDGIGSDSGYLGSRIHSLNRRRRHSRSEIWERLRDENGRRTTYCPSGLHPDGTCSCESLLMNEESSTRASISRIVMLAEALFEVLDEIHRQPVSLALSMVSLPAPESVVDSFPLKNHKKSDTTEAGQDVEQCYICLAEYDEGDKIRVLPCKHEYHMSCVDKWLKEIHGVCPLCRGDVREGATQCSVSDSEVPSI